MQIPLASQNFFEFVNTYITIIPTSGSRWDTVYILICHYVKCIDLLFIPEKFTNILRSIPNYHPLKMINGSS